MITFDAAANCSANLIKAGREAEYRGLFAGTAAMIYATTYSNNQVSEREAAKALTASLKALGLDKSKASRTVQAIGSLYNVLKRHYPRTFSLVSQAVNADDWSRKAVAVLDVPNVFPTTPDHTVKGLIEWCAIALGRAKEKTEVSRYARAKGLIEKGVENGEFTDADALALVNDIFGMKILGYADLVMLADVLTDASVDAKRREARAEALAEAAEAAEEADAGEADGLSAIALAS